MSIHLFPSAYIKLLYFLYWYKLLSRVIVPWPNDVRAYTLVSVITQLSWDITQKYFYDTPTHSLVDPSDAHNVRWFGNSPVVDLGVANASNDGDWKETARDRRVYRRATASVNANVIRWISYETICTYSLSAVFPIMFRGNPDSIWPPVFTCIFRFRRMRHHCLCVTVYTWSFTFM